MTRTHVLVTFFRTKFYHFIKTLKIKLNYRKICHFINIKKKLTRNKNNPLNDKINMVILNSSLIIQPVKVKCQ